jgi:hypothetical protein
MVAAVVADEAAEAFMVAAVEVARAAVVAEVFMVAEVAVAPDPRSIVRRRLVPLGRHHGLEAGLHSRAQTGQAAPLDQQLATGRRWPIARATSIDPVVAIGPRSAIDRA